MDRATTITIYSQKRLATRSGKIISVWVATVGNETVQADTLKGCKLRVAQAQDRQWDNLDFRITA